MYKYLLHIAISLIFATALVSCGESGKADNSESQKSGGSEFLTVKAAGVGALDASLAEKGRLIFEQKCTACHKYDTRLVGPALGDVAKKRSPEYILSMITNPGEMVKNNETAKQLFQEYMTEMTNQNITLEEAKAIYYHLLSVSSK